ncbi:MAG TPA: MotA/TolQ/ExbB proton channel family protein [Syntrophales bacterium]|nr:MotA/TolQ/ExbB proton channel family protein [Syntrophobacterales bacterium]HRR40718.1 MotA/TolQ/ExbB proton channel family protein [Syntrophales bacterium]HRT27229.1 MotA/TolQ/ExbB proton channel family protein [Syntrophales bacterium]
MWHILVKGGWMMIPIVLCSLVAVATIIDRFLFFRRIRKKNRGEEVIELVREGQIKNARQIVESEKIQSGLPIMKVLYAGITHPVEPEGAMEAAAVVEVSAMKRGLAALDTIITLSPLLGLLGTVIGMINAFNVMASSGLGQPHAVTGGVAEALICTAAGISVAVVALIPYNYFLARIERETDRIETMATRLELALGVSAGAQRRPLIESREADLHGSRQGVSV